MRRKKITIIFIILVLLVASAFLGLRFLKKPAPEKPETIPPEEVTPEESQLLIKELKEKLLKDAEISPSGPDVLIVLNSEKESSFGGPRFSIQYQTPFDLFLISLYDKPLTEVRKEAEQALLEKANGKLDILCQLNFLVSSPHSVRGDEIIENRESLNICKNR